MSPGPSVTVKTPSAKKPIRLFTEAWYVKKDNSVRRVGDAKSKFKAIRAGSTLWSIIPKRRVNIKINKRVNKYLYNCILQHYHVVRSPIANDCLKVYIYGHYEPQLVPKLLLQVFFRELHNSMVSPPEQYELK